MKLLYNIPFITTEGTGKETTITIDGRTGLFYKVVTGTYYTDLFSPDNSVIPVIMVHGDRYQQNVRLSCTGDELTITQGYQQSAGGVVQVWANDDWTDTNELKSVYIDSTKIKSVNLINGNTVAMTTTMNGLHVRLRSTGMTPSAGPYYAISVTTDDNKTYTASIQFLSHQSSSDPVRYDYIYADVNQPLQVFTK